MIMSRQEFIGELRRAMSGSFSAAEIEDAAVYYEDYITMQVKKGKREEEVLRKIGSPRLIAKSMKAAVRSAGRSTGAHRNAGWNAGAQGSAGGSTGAHRNAGWNAGAQGSDSANAGAWRRESGQAGSAAYDGGTANDEKDGYNGRMHTFRLPMWLVLLVVLLVLLIVFTIVFHLIIALLPISFFVLGIITLYRYFYKN